MSGKNKKIHVTREAITRAMSGDSSHCMIAESIRACIPGAVRISVDIQTIRYSDDSRGIRYVYLTPRAVQLAIIRFDEGVRPGAFTFELRGGQSVPIGRRLGTPGAKRESTPAQKNAITKAWKTRRRTIKNVYGYDSARPTIEGGSSPPTTTVGRRRTFGLCAIGSSQPRTKYDGSD